MLYEVITCVEGQAEIICGEETYVLNHGQTVLLPAAINTVQLISEDARLLEVYF